MKEEFKAYRLPQWFMISIGALKLIFASLLIVGIWWPELEKPAAAGIAILMLGAIIMHLKIKDPLLKSVPAFMFLILSLVLVFF